MKKASLYYIFVLGSLFIFNLLVFRNNQANDMLEKYILKSGKELSLLEIQKEAIEERRFNEQKLNGMLINILDSVYDVYGKAHVLKEIIGKRKVVLRFSELNCQTCINEQVRLLVSYSDSIHANNVILLTTFQNIEYMKRFRKITKLKMDIYNLSPSLNRELIDIGIPYFIILDNASSRINNAFVTSRNDEEQTYIYLNHIKKAYFTK